MRELNVTKLSRSEVYRVGPGGDIAIVTSGKTHSRKRTAISLWFNVCHSDDLGPPVSFVSDKLSEVGGRAPKNGATQSSNKPCVNLRIGKSCINLLVKPFNNFEGRVSGRANTLP